MKKFLTLIFLIPAIALAQVNHTNKLKPKTGNTETKTPAPKFDGFIIEGTITGFPDGTPVSFLNEQTGTPEQQATIKNGKFTIKGKMDQPGFKGLILNNAQPLIPLFLDNSDVKITGNKDALNNVVITGSPSHNQFVAFTTSIQPYEKVFTSDAEYDTASINKVSEISEKFVKNNPNSFVSPLAIIRLFQASQNGIKAEELYGFLETSVKLSPLGTYANKLIMESKINPIGSVITEFSQTDTSGKPINITAFRGKYVLLDFWASWCRPCRQENPNVVAAYDKFKSKNFTILGISLDQNKKAWLDAIKMDGLYWSHVSDLKGWSNEVAGIFKVTSIPQNILLDPDGKIIAKNLRGGALEARLNALVH